MNRILAILNSKYFLTTVIGLSILVLIIGVLLVKNANEQAVIYEQQKQAQVDDDPMAKINAMAAQAEMELKAAQSTETGMPKKIDFTESAESLSSLQSKNPEQGTEDWCKLMMTKPDTDWTPEENGIFAKHCL
jgi:hypothetical protein